MMTSLRFDLSAVQPEEGAPAPDRLVAGDPRFVTWSIDEPGQGLYAGVWQSTPGTWRIVYDEWEYFSVLEGYSIVTEDGGEPMHLRKGDRMILRPGFTGLWEVVETTTKDYVVRF
ncbi:cupin domain-containing protein [Agrobacterium vitis]|uniref:cupin domain-containing protein n=1 Tax=Agrobacterium vitis TaxID=373 RepID=UPI003D2C55D9